MFQKATKTDAKLRLALLGPAGAGKTYTALSIAAGLGGKVAVLDSEHNSASKYADLFDFDAMSPDSFSPQVYIDAIHMAEQGGYGVIVLDSLSHAWAGKGGALELVDAASRRAKGNKFVAWQDVTPLQQAMVDAIVGAKLHVIGTIRSKMEYAQDVDSDGRKVVKKLGMQPVQRDQFEYEWDVVGDLDNENTMTVTKSRIPALSGAVIRKPGKPMAEQLLGWLAGEKREQRPAEAPTKPPQQIYSVPASAAAAPAAGPVTDAAPQKAPASNPAADVLAFFSDKPAASPASPAVDPSRAQREQINREEAAATARVSRPATPPAEPVKTTAGPSKQPSLEEAQAMHKSAWGAAMKAAATSHHLQINPADSIGTIVDKANQLRETAQARAKAKAGGAAGK